MFHIKYSTEVHGWIVCSKNGKRFTRAVFESEWAARRYCEHALKKPYTVETPKTAGQHQELPNKSVWTGAPWDRSFKKL